MPSRTGRSPCRRAHLALVVDHGEGQMCYPCRADCCATTPVTLPADRVGAVVAHVLDAVADAFEGDPAGRAQLADVLRAQLGHGGPVDPAALSDRVDRETGTELGPRVLAAGLRAAAGRP